MAYELFCMNLQDNIFLEQLRHQHLELTSLRLLNESAQASATEVLYGVAQVVEARKVFLATGVLAAAWR